MTKNTNKLVFIIVNYNDYKTTKILIDNIKNYKSITEIVVVDNSTDDSYKNLKKLPQVTTLKTKNKGYSNALNVGSRYLINKYNNCNIFISNADIIIEKEQDLIELNNLLTKDIVIVGPTIIENTKKNRGWIIPTPFTEVLFNIPVLNKIANKKLKYNEEHYKNSYSYVDTVSGCFFLIDSKHLEKTNYFDETVFLYYEENILGIKTKVAKKKIIVANNIEVIHNHSVTISKAINKINRLKIQKTSQFYFQKEYNNANKIELLLLKISSSIGKIILSMYYTFNRK